MTAPGIVAHQPLVRKPRDEEVDVFGLTHIGNVRPNNQDHFLLCSLRKQVEVHLTSLPNKALKPEANERLAFLAMVADGVGGGAGGEEASRFTLEAVAEYVADAVRVALGQETAVTEQTIWTRLTNSIQPPVRRM